MTLRALLGSVRHQGLVATWWQRKWHANPQNEQRLRSFSLPANAVVLDGGGYRGEFAKDVLSACPSASLAIFEPEGMAASRLAMQFGGDSRVRVSEAALWKEDATLILEGKGLAASVNPSANLPENGTPVRAVDIAVVLEELGAVSLVKLNVEGAEYAILERMISSGTVNAVDQLLIQFHRVPAAAARYRKVSELLSRTHELSWRWPWTWEMWTHRPEDTRNA